MGTNVAAQNDDCYFTLISTPVADGYQKLSISKTCNALATLKLGLNGNVTHKSACVKTRLHDAKKICTKCMNPQKWTYFRDCCLVHMSRGRRKISTFHARNILRSQKNFVNILRFCCVSHVLVVASVNAA